MSQKELLDAWALRNMINAARNYAEWHGISIEDAVSDLAAILLDTPSKIADKPER
jgi:hypothetical protein